LLHLGWIVLAVTRTWHQAGKTQMMQQRINARQRILDSKFPLENPLRVFGSQAAHAIGGGGTRQETSLEALVLGQGQLAGPTRLPLGANRIEAVITIGVHPPLHEASAAGQDLSDRRGAVAFQSQENRSITVSLFGVTFLPASLTQLLHVPWMMSVDSHLAVPPVSLRVCQTSEDRATPF
jgi:hypothetical protein